LAKGTQQKKKIVSTSAGKIRLMRFPMGENLRAKRRVTSKPQRGRAGGKFRKKKTGGFSWNEKGARFNKKGGSENKKDAEKQPTKKKKRLGLTRGEFSK